jgi:SAM-dependent methyltransferase
MFNRQQWHEASFHRSIAALARVSSGEQVLDLGCGRGATLEALLEGLGEASRVFALDRMETSLKAAAARFPQAVQAGRLMIVRGEVLKSPFPDDMFDVVVCQNVIECVSDRRGLVAEAKRILKPGGRFLLGHHDFDGIVLASDERELTKRLVHGFADYTQDWQDVSEGRMGRMIPGLVVDAGFASVEIETRMIVDLGLEKSSYARGYLDSLVELAPRFGVSSGEVSHWRAKLEADAIEGRFYFGLPWVAAICCKATS